MTYGKPIRFRNSKALLFNCRTAASQTYRASSTLTSSLRPISPSLWQKGGNACTLCKREFTFFIRRHHCRFCGLLCCAKCSDATLRFGRLDMRACDTCVERSNRNSAAQGLQRHSKNICPNFQNSVNEDLTDDNDDDDDDYDYDDDNHNSSHYIYHNRHDGSGRCIKETAYGNNSLKSSSSLLSLLNFTPPTPSDCEVRQKPRSSSLDERSSQLNSCVLKTAKTSSRQPSFDSLSYGTDHYPKNDRYNLRYSHDMDASPFDKVYDTTTCFDNRNSGLLSITPSANDNAKNNSFFTTPKAQTSYFKTTRSTPCIGRHTNDSPNASISVFSASSPSDYSIIMEREQKGYNLIGNCSSITQYYNNDFSPRDTNNNIYRASSTQIPSNSNMNQDNAEYIMMNLQQAKITTKTEAASPINIGLSTTTAQLSEKQNSNRHEKILIDNELGEREREELQKPFSFFSTEQSNLNHWIEPEEDDNLDTRIDIPNFKSCDTSSTISCQKETLIETASEMLCDVSTSCNNADDLLLCSDPQNYNKTETMLDDASCIHIDGPAATKIASTSWEAFDHFLMFNKHNHVSESYKKTLSLSSSSSSLCELANNDDATAPMTSYCKNGKTLASFDLLNPLKSSPNTPNFFYEKTPSSALLQQFSDYNNTETTGRVYPFKLERSPSVPYISYHRDTPVKTTKSLSKIVQMDDPQNLFMTKPPLIKDAIYSPVKTNFLEDDIPFTLPKDTNKLIPLSSMNHKMKTACLRNPNNNNNNSSYSSCTFNSTNPSSMAFFDNYNNKKEQQPQTQSTTIMLPSIIGEQEKLTLSPTNKMCNNNNSIDKSIRQPSFPTNYFSIDESSFISKEDDDDDIEDDNDTFYHCDTRLPKHYLTRAVLERGRSPIVSQVSSSTSSKKTSQCSKTTIAAATTFPSNFTLLQNLLRFAQSLKKTAGGEITGQNVAELLAIAKTQFQLRRNTFEFIVILCFLFCIMLFFQPFSLTLLILRIPFYCMLGLISAYVTQTYCHCHLVINIKQILTSYFFRYYILLCILQSGTTCVKLFATRFINFSSIPPIVKWIIPLLVPTTLQMIAIISRTSVGLYGRYYSTSVILHSCLFIIATLQALDQFASVLFTKLEHYSYYYLHSLTSIRNLKELFHFQLQSTTALVINYVLKRKITYSGTCFLDFIATKAVHTLPPQLITYGISTFGVDIPLEFSCLSIDTVERLIFSELHVPMKHLFTSFSLFPIECTVLSTTHRATLRKSLAHCGNSTNVLVTLHTRLPPYCNSEAAWTWSLAHIDWFLHTAGKIAPAFKPLYDFHSYWKQLKEGHFPSLKLDQRILDACELRGDASRSFLRIPPVYTEWQTAHIIITDDITGVSLTDLGLLDLIAVNRKALLSRIIQSLAQTILFRGIVPPTLLPNKTQLLIGGSKIYKKRHHKPKHKFFIDEGVLRRGSKLHLRRLTKDINTDNTAYSSEYEEERLKCDIEKTSQPTSYSSKEIYLLVSWSDSWNEADLTARIKFAKLLISMAQLDYLGCERALGQMDINFAPTSISEDRHGVFDFLGSFIRKLPSTTLQSDTRGPLLSRMEAEDVPIHFLIAGRKHRKFIDCSHFGFVDAKFLINHVLLNLKRISFALKVDMNFAEVLAETAQLFLLSLLQPYPPKSIMRATVNLSLINKGFFGYNKRSIAAAPSYLVNLDLAVQRSEGREQGFHSEEPDQGGFFVVQEQYDNKPTPGTSSPCSLSSSSSPFFLEGNDTSIALARRLRILAEKYLISQGATIGFQICVLRSVRGATTTTADTEIVLNMAGGVLSMTNVEPVTEQTIFPLMDLNILVINALLMSVIVNLRERSTRLPTEEVVLQNEDYNDDFLTMACVINKEQEEHQLQKSAPHQKNRMGCRSRSRSVNTSVNRQKFLIKEHTNGSIAQDATSYINKKNSKSCEMLQDDASKPSASLSRYHELKNKKQQLHSSVIDFDTSISRVLPCMLNSEANTVSRNNSYDDDRIRKKGQHFILQSTKILGLQRRAKITFRHLLTATDGLHYSVPQNVRVDYLRVLETDQREFQRFIESTLPIWNPPQWVWASPKKKKSLDPQIKNDQDYLKKCSVVLQPHSKYTKKLQTSSKTPENDQNRLTSLQQQKNTSNASSTVAKFNTAGVHNNNNNSSIPLTTSTLHNFFSSNKQKLSLSLKNDKSTLNTTDPINSINSKQPSSIPPLSSERNPSNSPNVSSSVSFARTASLLSYGADWVTACGHIPARSSFFGRSAIIRHIIKSLFPNETFQSVFQRFIVKPLNLDNCLTFGFPKVPVTLQGSQQAMSRQNTTAAASVYNGLVKDFDSRLNTMTWSLQHGFTHSYSRVGALLEKRTHADIDPTVLNENDISDNDNNNENDLLLFTDRHRNYLVTQTTPATRNQIDDDTHSIDSSDTDSTISGSSSSNSSFSSINSHSSIIDNNDYISRAPYVFGDTNQVQKLIKKEIPLKKRNFLKATTPQYLFPPDIPADPSIVNSPSFQESPICALGFYGTAYAVAKLLIGLLSVPSLNDETNDLSIKQQPYRATEGSMSPRIRNSENNCSGSPRKSFHATRSSSSTLYSNSSTSRLFENSKEPYATTEDYSKDQKPNNVTTKSILGLTAEDVLDATSLHAQELTLGRSRQWGMGIQLFSDMRLSRTNSSLSLNDNNRNKNQDALLTPDNYCNTTPRSTIATIKNNLFGALRATNNRREQNRAKKTVMISSDHTAVNHNVQRHNNKDLLQKLQKSPHISPANIVPSLESCKYNTSPSTRRSSYPATLKHDNDSFSKVSEHQLVADLCGVEGSCGSLAMFSLKDGVAVSFLTTAITIDSRDASVDFVVSVCRELGIELDSNNTSNSDSNLNIVGSFVGD